MGERAVGVEESPEAGFVSFVEDVFVGYEAVGKITNNTCSVRRHFLFGHEDIKANGGRHRRSVRQGRFADRRIDVYGKVMPPRPSPPASRSIRHRDGS